jgi:CRISPR-associated protein Cmr4
MCLSRLRFDLRSAGLSDRLPAAVPDVPGEETVLVPKGAGDLLMEGKVFLSEFPFESKENEDLAKIAAYLSGRLPAGHDYFRDKLYSAKGNAVHSNLVLVHDDVFRDLLTIRTEVVHRNVIDKKTGTTQNLWTEENLPGDVLMYSLIYAADPYQPNGTLRTAGDVADFLESNNLAAFILGGSQTVGRGWISATFDKPEAAGAKGESNAAKPKK